MASKPVNSTPSEEEKNKFQQGVKDAVNKAFAQPSDRKSNPVGSAAQKNLPKARSEVSAQAVGGLQPGAPTRPKTYGVNAVPTSRKSQLAG